MALSANIKDWIEWPPMTYRNMFLHLSLLCISYPVAGQAGIYKCTDEQNVVIYRDRPCDTGQLSVPLSGAPMRSLPAHMTSAYAVKPQHSQQPPIQFNNLVVGMTDTEVLNLRGWGPPGKITRSKANGTYLEEWTYLLPVDRQTLLQFANGKLVAINNGEAAASAAQTMVRISP